MYLTVKNYKGVKESSSNTVLVYLSEAFLQKHAHIGKTQEYQLTDEEKSTLHNMIFYNVS